MSFHAFSIDLADRSHKEMIENHMMRSFSEVFRGFGYPRPAKKVNENDTKDIMFEAFSKDLADQSYIETIENHILTLFS